MKLLILGGTGFLGPQCVEAALARKHTLTLFNRGRTNPGLFPDIEQIHGDRRKDINLLKGREWDWVIDTSAYLPQDIEQSMSVLAGACKQYVMVSTISVYGQNVRPPITEDSPVEKLPEADKPDPRNPAHYGPLKALCEQAAEKAMPGRVTNIRPGLIVGPGDPTDRFTYWPLRLARGGEVLCPMPQDQRVQFIDVRDLGRWIVQMLDEGHTGVYNAVGPTSEMTMAGLIHGCRAVVSNDLKLTWVDEAFLDGQGVGKWMELPLWIGADDGFAQASSEKAKAVGLTFRPLADTARDTLAWANTREPDHNPAAGLAPQKESAVLKAWHERVPTTIPG